MIKKCPKCENDIDYSMSEIHLIPDIDPAECEKEGVCGECGLIVYIKFKEYTYEIVK